MKLQKPIIILGFLIIVLVAGCQNADHSFELQTQELSPTITLDENTPVSKFTIMPLPSLTPSPMFTIPLTRTPPVISTKPSISPTYSADYARKSLKELLYTNGGCPLPCFWNIVPSKSTVQEAQSILLSLSSISTFSFYKSGLGDVSLTYLENDLIIDIRVTYLASADEIYRISFQARALRELKEEQGVYSVYDSGLFYDLLSYYMLPHILSEFGFPREVLVSTLAEIPSSRHGSGNFNVLLLYPDQGMLIHYTSEMKVDGNNVVGCPVNSHIEMELFPSGIGDKFYELLGPTYWPEIIRNDYKPLEEITSLSIEDFYQEFRLPTDECLTTPANLWPVPEK